MQVKFMNLWTWRHRVNTGWHGGIKRYKARPIWWSWYHDKGRKIIHAAKDGELRGEWVSYFTLICCNLYLFVSRKHRGKI